MWGEAAKTVNRMNPKVDKLAKGSFDFASCFPLLRQEHERNMKSLTTGRTLTLPAMYLNPGLGTDLTYRIPRG